jgi:small GTP-binding protein
MQNIKRYSFKLVLLGDASVGKSSLALQFIKRQFNNYQEATIGASFFTHIVPLEDCNVKFEIWDTAGQERYHSLAPMYYRGAHAAIVVYDVTNNDSYVAAQSWIKEIRQQGNSNTMIMLVGNKVDLGEARKVECKIAKKYATDNNYLFIEASAKNDYNVQEIFKVLAESIPKVEANAKYDSVIVPEKPKKNSYFYCCST